MILPYSIFEILTPGKYNPIDIDWQTDYNVPFHVPTLTISMMILATPVFFTLKWI